MAKRGSRRGKPRKVQAGRKELYRGLYEADKLMESEKYPEARFALQELDRRFPDNADVLRGLTNACLALRVFLRFLELWPEDERAAQVGETIATMKRIASERLSAMGFAEEEFDEP